MFSFYLDVYFLLEIPGFREHRDSIRNFIDSENTSRALGTNSPKPVSFHMSNVILIQCQELKISFDHESKIR